MADSNIEQPKRSLIRRRLLAVIAGIILAVFVAAVFVLSTGMNVPKSQIARVERVLGAAVPGLSVKLDQMRFQLFVNGPNAEVLISDVRLLDSDGRLRVNIPEIHIEVSGKDMVFGKLKPVSAKLTGARLLVRRDAFGRYDLRFDDREQDQSQPKFQSVADIFAAIQSALEGDLLSELKVLEAEKLSLLLDDAISGRRWRMVDGAAEFLNEAEKFQASLRLSLEGQGEAAQSSIVQLGFSKVKSADEVDVSVKFDQLESVAIADQVAAFDWLRILKAPISGAMNVQLTEAGEFGRLNGVLEIGQGQIVQNAEKQPLHFDGAKAYLSFDPELEKFTIDQISVDTKLGRFAAAGQVYLSDRIDRTVGSLIAQLRFSEIELAEGPYFAKPVRFDFGAADLRIRLNPLELDIGQLVLADPETKFIAKGFVKSAPLGWKTRLDLSSAALDRARMLELWPLTLQHKTRKWIAQNVFSAGMSNITAALRGTPGEPLNFALGGDFENAAVRFLKAMPPIENGSGYLLMAENKMNLVLSQGTITAPDGDEVNLAGSVFQISDTRVKGSPATVILKTQSSLPSGLEVLDMKPFEFLKKADVATDIASGVLATESKITFPLVEKVTLDEVSYEVLGTIKSVKSDRLIKGKSIEAERLDLVADNAGMTISGSAHIGDVPISGLWRQEFNRTNPVPGVFEGQIELSPAFLEEFDISLPDGMVQGRGIGSIEITLEKGKSPGFLLLSDLNQIGLSIDGLGWRKKAASKGLLEVRGIFGEGREISVLKIEASDLLAEGKVSFDDTGTFKRIRFEKFNLGKWLSTKVDVTNDSRGGTVLTLRGGMLDFRNSALGKTASKSGEGVRIATNLDRLVLSSGLSLTDVKGDLSTKGGATGSFSGRVNGGAEIVGTLAPFNKGTGVRFSSDDAGAVMKSSGIFTSAVGGRMDMVLVPNENRGEYEGQLVIKNTRVRDATGLSDLLSAISVVGLLEQLAGEGISFNDVEADFLLKPTGMHVLQSSAVGASMGITMRGNYDFTNRSIDMAGVITPIYVLNGFLEKTKIFGSLFGAQKGEGLFGFNYSLRGPVDAPEVGVNPLSVLTPGLFRDIFRQPMPVTGQ